MLDRLEKELVRSVEARLPEQLGTFNHEGVREVGRCFAGELEALGFSTRWAELPPEMGRAGHLVAERITPNGRGRRLLLLGHLDTVFEGAGHRFERSAGGERARGAGVADMKGGDAVILFSLRALQDARVLEGTTVRVILTGDEENPALPGEVSRRELALAAAESDAVLSFESDSGKVAIGRRGLSTWSLSVSGQQGHSASVLRPWLGAGAIYESARVLDAFRRELSGHPNVTVNAGIVLGGTRIAYDSAASAGTAAGKFNVVAPAAMVKGDLRFVTDAERDGAKNRMTEIAAEALPRTASRLEFEDLAPGWPASEPNRGLLEIIDSVSRDLGHGPLEPDDPASRGFGDMNFIGASVAGADGLGVRGWGEHGPEESIDLTSLGPATARAAVLLARLLRADASPGL